MIQVYILQGQLKPILCEFFVKKIYIVTPILQSPCNVSLLKTLPSLGCALPYCLQAWHFGEERHMSGPDRNLSDSMTRQACSDP